MLKRFSLALTAAFIASSVNAQTLYPNLPILGGASYCDSTQNAASQNTCTNTVPAGPAMTGLETLGADTNAANGAQPQSVKVPFTAVGLGPYVYNAPVTTDSITIAATTRRLVLEPAGTIAALTLVFPAAAATSTTQALIDGQLLNVCSTQIVTTLTITNGSGTTVLNKPTAMLVPVVTGAASCFGWIYRASNTSWYRIQ